MSRKKKVKCSKCGKPLFYLPSGYGMSFDVVCIDCADKKIKAPKPKLKATATSKFSRTKKGKRADLGNTIFRSAMEANFARILRHEKVAYKFEERTFFFHDYKNRPNQYTPDFEVASEHNKFPSGWYETKGWLDGKSRSKMRRFKKHYPDDFNKTIIVVYRKTDKAAITFCQKEGYKFMLYDQLTEKYAPLIPTWE